MWRLNFSKNILAFHAPRFELNGHLHYFVNDIAEVKDRQDSSFYEGKFGSISEGCFDVK